METKVDIIQNVIEEAQKESASIKDETTRNTKLNCQYNENESKYKR